MSLAVVPSGPDPNGPDPGGETPRDVQTVRVTQTGLSDDGMQDVAALVFPNERAATGHAEPLHDEDEPRDIWPNANGSAQKLIPAARPTMEVFRAIFQALDAHARPVIGPAERELFAIPLHDHDGTVTGGLWASTMFRWLNVELLFVPETLRGRGVGSALLAAAETEAVRRGCLGAFVDTASFQAPGFYQRLGYTLYGRLGDFPPGHERLYFRKLFSSAA